MVGGRLGEFWDMRVWGVGGQWSLGAGWGEVGGVLEGGLGVLGRKLGEFGGRGKLGEVGGSWENWRFISAVGRGTGRVWCTHRVYFASSFLGIGPLVHNPDPTPPPKPPIFLHA